MRSGTMQARKRRSSKRESGTPYLVSGLVILCATIAFVVFGRLAAPWQAFAALGAGAALGIWLFRFGSRHAWVSQLCLFGALVVWVALFVAADTVGSAGIAWIGSFVAGTNLGRPGGVRSIRRVEGIALLLKLSQYLDELEEDVSAAWFRQCAEALKKESSRKQLLEMCRDILHSLDNGPGRLPDLYFAHPDGSPDPERTAAYVDTIRDVRRFARHAVPPWSLFAI